MNILIQLNGLRLNKNHKNLNAHVDATVKRATNQFRHRISQVEVHLEKVNSLSLNDKHCALEAQLEGLPPIVATYRSECYDHAVDGAVAALKTALVKDFGHRKQH